jgi:tRNA(Ile)-lysidine synthase
VAGPRRRGLTHRGPLTEARTTIVLDMSLTSRAPARRRPPAVARVLERVTGTAREHRMFAAGGTVVVAVSGGPDSVCLLHALHALRRLLRIRLACFHFDHGLRPDAGADADYVRRLAARLNVPFVLRRADGRPAKGESPEAWARTVRYQALFEVVEEIEATAAAVGHTADDQAETVLLALLRGGGLEAMSGMAPVSPPVVRPLLAVSRQETEAFCRSLRLRPRRDPMNEDPSYMRAALRGRVIPMLAELVGRGVRSAVVRTAALLRDDAALLEELADRAATDVIVPGVGSSERRLHAARLQSLARALATRVVRRALMDLGLLPEAAHVDAVLDLAAGRPGRKVSLPEGLIAARHREYVRLSRPSSAGSPPAPPRRAGQPQGRIREGAS